MSELRELTKEEIVDLLVSTQKHLKKFMIRVGDSSTTIHFFNTNNSCNCTVNIFNHLIDRYGIKLTDILQ